MSWTLRQRIALFVSLLTLFVLGGCGDSKPPEIQAQDPVWSSIISAHTAGEVSRKSSVRVVFVNDVVDSGRIGQSADAVFKISPSVDGKLNFVSAREIVLAPAGQLKPGQYYRVTIRNKDLKGVPDTLKEYSFAFRALAQQIEVRVDGLASGDGAEQDMSLRGSVVLADVDDADKVTQVLVARQAGKTLPIAWQPGADERRFDFTVSGITRADSAQTLALSWNGKPLGTADTGTREIEVPARNVFKVTRIQALRDTGQYIQIEFSDNLDTRQNLKGFVRTSSGNFSARAEGNTIRLTPGQTVEGDVTVNVEPGLRNARGDKLIDATSQTVAFVSEKPKVRFVGNGVILPQADKLTVPIETVNARSVQITAFRVYDNNMGQFLQTNKLDGQQELGRVGRYLWRRTVRLSAPEPNKWNRYALDVTSLFQQHPGGLFRLTLSIDRADSAYNCPGATSEADDVAPPLASDDDLNRHDGSSWDYAENYYGVDSDGEDNQWRHREDPCKAAYFRYNNNVRSARNFVASNIGLVAKRGQHGRLFAVATDLRTAKPLGGTKFTVMNFQNRPIGNGESDGDGMAQLAIAGTPFYLLAEKDGQKGYLKLSPGTALPVSHFDVGGERVTAGIKGFIYGERGVWRPGDEVFLVFLLQDKEKTLPANHPVTLEVYNPKKQLIHKLTNATPLDGFYRFSFKTADDAPTGDWTAKAVLGGVSFTKTVKIETVMPNRLKVELDFGKETLKGSEPLSGKLSSQWLSGASAAGLNADVKVRLQPTATKFERSADFTFDDPAREFEHPGETVFDGTLDDNGNADVTHRLNTGDTAPGMLTASFSTRVFERGGAFSVNSISLPFAPYDRFVGVKLPKGDASRNMLLTDKTHTVEIASLSADGKPVSLKNVQVTLYKVEWRWWWDKSGDSLAKYATSSHVHHLAQDTVATRDGRGEWKFEIKYPDWGRYLVRACDIDGGHCTGKVLYIDWPGWAGRAQEQAGPGANALNFTADKPEYVVGETATVQLPEASSGRALVTVESGSSLLQQQWIEFGKDRTTFKLAMTRDMSPNVFVSVTLLQAHADKKNDRPIRLYGVIPIKVNDPETRIEPQLKAADEWAPDTEVNVEVSEKSGKPMTYTLAVVDEGLLGLTGFRTPNPHAHFYRREALGVSTWDLFDDVVGAYGGELERLLALGGSDELDAGKAQQEKKRFPPVVQFLGPFELGKRDSNKHSLRLPQYVGAVRVMVVAGKSAAYGAAEKSVFVRQPLMILPTVPRVVGPEEEITVPVSVFAMDASVKQVALKMEADERFEIVSGSTTVNFTKPEEKLGMLKLRVRPGTGKGLLRFSASSGNHQAKAQVYLDVRSPNPPTVTFQRKILKPGETWDAAVTPHGLPGTNSVALEMSAVPPLDLERRLDYLIRYPHGCLEQTTSAAFPQLYLPLLLKLEDARKQDAEKNVAAAIDKLRGFQTPGGGFLYWPGGFYGTYNAYDAWTTSYVGHFLIEAERLGYALPTGMLANWTKHQKTIAGTWSGSSGTMPLDQAYRLYTLALAKQPEIGAMNRLREHPRLDGTARWLLASAYRLAGLNDVASDLVKDARAQAPGYSQPDQTFGSTLRDSAILLTSAIVLERDTEIRSLVDQVSADLVSERWHSTHALSFSLMAMAKFAGSNAREFVFERELAGAKRETVKVKLPLYSETLRGFPDKGANLRIKNTSGGTLFAGIVVRGVAKAGSETAAASGLTLDVSYADAAGGAIDVARLRQGQDFVAFVSIKNESSLKIDNLALTQILPSGWEIHNARLAGEEEIVDSTGAERGPRAWWAAFVDGGGAPETMLDYLDIRDDRVHRYFSLKPGEHKRFRTTLNAAYLGRFYLPGVTGEAMYDASKHGRTTGKWVEVVPAGQ